MLTYTNNLAAQIPLQSTADLYCQKQDGAISGSCLMYWWHGWKQTAPEPYTGLENPSCSTVRSDYGKAGFTWLWHSGATVMEVSSLSWSTQTQQCYSCISSCYSTFFNNTLLQFPSGDGPWVACHRGVLLGSAALWLLAFPFTTGKSYSHHLLAVCRSPTSYQAVTPGQLQSCKHFESAQLHSEGDGPGKAGAASPHSSTAAPTGTTSGHPELLSHQRLQRLPGTIA